jgi:hypothetical protein
MFVFCGVPVCFTNLEISFLKYLSRAGRVSQSNAFQHSIPEYNHNVETYENSTVFAQNQTEVSREKDKG